jgi:hypothetical protein
MGVPQAPRCDMSTEVCVVGNAASDLLTSDQRGPPRAGEHSHAAQPRRWSLWRVHCRCLSSCRALASLDLSGTNVNNAGIAGLESIASLTQLDLKGCKRIISVRVLGASRSIRILNLAETSVTAEGIAALSKIPTLEAVALMRCQKLNDLRNLRGCRSLRRLWLAGTSIVDGGLEGLESVVNLDEPWRGLQWNLDTVSSKLD